MILKVESFDRSALSSFDTWVLFTPLKPDRVSFLIEKLTELGVSTLYPIQTERTQKFDLKYEKMRLTLIEAAEQCERLSIPILHEKQPLDSLLKDWPQDRPLLWADESRTDPLMLTELESLKTDRIALLIGPEGGFSEAERQKLRSYSYCRPISLGPNILRAETAAICTVSLLHQYLLHKNK
jgi:16S rRNA (uracil1498-N3)-methyltransferase